jgi:ATP-dependent helicase/nuclease subunit A
MSGRMTEKELSALDDDAVRAFLESDIGRRVLNSETVYKEYEFSVLRPAEEFYGELPQYAQDEQIVVQGKLDCSFIENGKAVLIDYKTDNITDEDEYRRLYTSQLSIYADALTQCTGFSVEEKYIYSFKLKRFILI